MTQDAAQASEAKGKAGAPTPRRGRGIRLKTLRDVRLEMSRVYSDARRGVIEPETGSKLTFMLTQVAKIIEGSDLEERLAKLERRACD